MLPVGAVQDRATSSYYPKRFAVGCAENREKVTWKIRFRA